MAPKGIKPICKHSLFVYPFNLCAVMLLLALCQPGRNTFTSTAAYDATKYSSCLLVITAKYWVKLDRSGGGFMSVTLFWITALDDESYKGQLRGPGWGWARPGGKGVQM